MPTPFIMDDSIRRALAELATLAMREDRRIPIAVLQEHSQGFDPEDPNSRRTCPFPLDQTLTLPLGWKVTLTIEEQPFGLARHMSLSSPALGRAPGPEAIVWTMEALGFVRPLQGCMVYMEQYRDKRYAINVMEPVDPKVAFGKEPARA